MPTYLDFERPIAELETRVAELRETADGALVVKTNDAGHETLAAAPAPVMWDSSDTTTASPDPAVEEVDAHVVDTSAGGKIVAAQDHTGTIFNPNGFDLSLLIPHIKATGGVGGFNWLMGREILRTARNEGIFTPPSVRGATRTSGW